MGTNSVAGPNVMLSDDVIGQRLHRLKGRSVPPQNFVAGLDGGTATKFVVITGHLCKTVGHGISGGRPGRAE